jgi:glycosyltransferase involved in cell wall biosynthesis
VSEFSKNWFETNIPNAKIHRVYNGMLLDNFIPPITSKSPRILSVGRLVEKKGFSDLVKACRNLLDRGLKFSCGIVGEGPIKNQLVTMIADLGLSQHVTLYGALPQREIRQLLHQSSIFALACVKEKDGGMDILPTVITEAMAAGLPVVSTRLAGIPEMVVDQVTGLLSNPGDVSAFANSLAALLSHPQTAFSMGVEGRRRAEKVFNEEVTIPELLSILET